MNAARRDRRRRDWPRGLYEPRQGYYVWRHPLNGKTYPLGRVPLAVARSEAIAANLHIAEQRPALMEMLTGASKTVAELLKEMPAADRPNTIRTNRHLDKRITEALGTVPVGVLSVRQCAELVEAVAKEGKARTAEALRSRLIAACKRGMQLGWMDSNPAEVTARPKVRVQRGRLTLESFRAIHAKAAEVAPWLPRAMMLALLTGADVSTVAAMRRDDVRDGYLVIRRSKTGASIAIPTRIRLEALGLSLADVLAEKAPVVSAFLVCHHVSHGRQKAGEPVHHETISKAFLAARRAAGIADEGAPTMHETRSLAVRLYGEQGNVDVRALTGHATEAMTDVYRDPRGVEARRVRVV